MAIVKLEVQKAKEVDEVMNLIVALIKNRKADESLASLVDELMTALGGIDQITDELKANRLAVLETVGSKLGAIVEALLD